ncbi:DUF4349 domain-containing protein [Candidatus Woesearchaeota archaeon]|nr:DUF4349 domain-containing protein [Candidatus Woesearchaeota archaeon]
MTIKKQLIKVKENWLLILIIILLFIAVSGLNINLFSTGILSQDKLSLDSSAAMERGFYPPIMGGFAPDVEERVIIKTAQLSTEVERGEFQKSESKLKEIVELSNSFILNHNVNKQGTERELYFSGNYELKVEVLKYNSVVSQLKEIGEVKSFSENELDVTGTHTDLTTQLESENERLQRFKIMFDETQNINDKIELTDRIFNQERTIKFIEDSLKNINQDVQYSTIHVNIVEKQSEYKDVLFIKISDIARSFVNSFNNLIKLLIILIPWIILALVIYFVYNRFRY